MDGTAKPNKLLAAMPGHLLSSAGFGDHSSWHHWFCVRFQCFLAVGVSQLGQSEPCLPHRDSREESWQAAGAAQAAKASFWQKRPHLMSRYFCITIQSRFESVDSSRLWVPSGIYKTDMLSNNKFHSEAMKSREPTSVWTLAAPALWGQFVALWYFQCAEEVKVK